jgi:hypothetical protein
MKETAKATAKIFSKEYRLEKYITEKKSNEVLLEACREALYALRKLQSSRINNTLVIFQLEQAIEQALD